MSWLIYNSSWQKGFKFCIVWNYSKVYRHHDPLSAGQISVRIVWRINLSLYLLHFPEFLNQILEHSTGEYPHSVKLCPCYSIRDSVLNDHFLHLWSRQNYALERNEIALSIRHNFLEQIEEAFQISLLLISCSQDCWEDMPLWCGFQISIYCNDAPNCIYPH